MQSKLSSFISESYANYLHVWDAVTVVVFLIIWNAVIVIVIVENIWGTITVGIFKIVGDSVVVIVTVLRVWDSVVIKIFLRFSIRNEKWNLKEPQKSGEPMKTVAWRTARRANRLSTWAVIWRPRAMPSSAASSVSHFILCL